MLPKLMSFVFECINRNIMSVCACFRVYKRVSYSFLKVYYLWFTSVMRIREVKGCAQSHNGKAGLKLGLIEPNSEFIP